MGRAPHSALETTQGKQKGAEPLGSKPGALERRQHPWSHMGAPESRPYAPMMGWGEYCCLQLGRELPSGPALTVTP